MATLYRDLEDMSRPVYSAAGHTEIINCIDGVGGLGIGEGAPEIATGSRDGKNKPLFACLFVYLFVVCLLVGCISFQMV